MKDRNNYTVVLDFRVEGERHTIDIDPDEPLLWVLCVDVGRAAAAAPPVLPVNPRSLPAATPASFWTSVCRASTARTCCAPPGPAATIRR